MKRRSALSLLALGASAGLPLGALASTDAWVASKAGEAFNVPANSSFDIRVTEAYHYICHFA